MATNIPSPEIPRVENRGSSGTVIRSSRRVCSSVDVWLQNASYAIVNHFVWKSLIVLFTMVLLFGRPIQFWWFLASSDPVMSALYLLGFVIFVIDMIFHSYLDPLYLPFISCDWNCRHNNRQSFPSVQMGSFNFWCDLSSTICFLADVDFIFPSRFECTTTIIKVDKFGIPCEGDFAAAFGTKNPVTTNHINLLIVIFKTLRVARLVPPNMVLNIWSRINWYLKCLSPHFYRERFQKRRRMNREANRNMAASGGGLLRATVAVMKAMKEKEKKIKERGKLVFAGYTLKKWGERALRFLRILPNTNVELNRHIAATRIQRAWRNRNTFNTELRSDEGDEGQAWKSTREFSTTSFEALDMSRRSRLDGSNYRGLQTGSEIEDSNNVQNRKLIRRQGKEKKSSQVGTAIYKLTGERVTLFLLTNLLVVLLSTYSEFDTTDVSTMLILHQQTTKAFISHQTTEEKLYFVEKAVDTARRTSVPNLYQYTATSSLTNVTFHYGDIEALRQLDKREIIVEGDFAKITGLFSIEVHVDLRAKMELTLLAFALLTWFFGVAAFSGPIMSLVIVPIERLVTLLSMLVMDPLGYRSTLTYKKYLTEADQIATKNGQWTRDVLKGMETEFLTSTIIRIGSLMKVGFGSAGAQIIRHNLQKNDNNDTSTLLLNSQGSMVSCIFLFCDIRSFTDVTECLQEEVFVFTNQIADVVHSICNSYGGSANKNVGDAFLISWRLDESSYERNRSFRGVATHNQADKALLSVVKICIALHHDDYYVKKLSENAKETLLKKLESRPGPTVQIGFGLHAGKAVEGAIGSQRKIDATFVSMAVEMAEYLESSTKKYKVPMLMSCSFHRLLQRKRRQRCRKIDCIMFENKNDESYGKMSPGKGKLMELFTYDIHIDALWEKQNTHDGDSESGEITRPITLIRNHNGAPKMSKQSQPEIFSRTSHNDTLSQSTRSRSADITDTIRSRGGEITAAIVAVAARALGTEPLVSKEANHGNQNGEETPELVLPTGPALYSERIWLQLDMRRIRRRYTTDIFNMFNLGLQKYYSSEWDEAKMHFEAILNCFEDGPSKYFFGEMGKHKGIPPPDFLPYGKS